MNLRALLAAAVVAGTCLGLGAAAPAGAQGQTATPKEAPATMHAKGSFEVKMTQQPADEKSEDAGVGRLSGEKQFHGDLEGTSKVQMLGVQTAVKGSAGYVAMEKVTGTIAGRTGSFVLQHSGTMNRGDLQLSVTVVPDSGTGQFTGISGSMTIEIKDGKHFYDFAYTLPEKP